jgi:hypothetical protein
MLPPHGVLILAEPLSGNCPQPPPSPMPISASTSPPWARAAPARPEKIERLAKEAGFASLDVVKTRNAVVTGMLRITVS